MTITANVEGLGKLNFPDGTDPNIIQSTVKRMIAEKSGQQSQQKIIELTPSTDQIEQPTVEQQPTVIDKAKDFIVNSPLVETADAIATVGSGLVGEVAGGLTGGVSSLLPGEQGAGAETAAKISEAIAQQPRTEGGRKSVTKLGDLIELGVDIVNFPISGLGGLTELISGQGLDQAVSTIKSVQDDGVGKTAGERVLEETGSPLAATVAEVAPAAALLALPLKTKPRAKSKITPERAKEIEQTIVAGEKQGIDVLTSDVLKPETVFSKLSQQFSERVPFIGTGGKRAVQQKQRVQALDDLDKSIPAIQSEDILTSLVQNSSKAKNAAGKRLNAVIESMNTQGAVPVNNTVTRINKAIEKLSAPGKIKDEGLIKTLEELKVTAREVQNFEALRTFRTDARSGFDKVDPAGRSQLKSTDKVITDGIIDGITKDLDGFVLRNSNERGLSRYKAADNVYRQEALKLTKSRLKTILDKGEITPELVNNLLFSSKPSEVNLLFKNLGASGRQNARMSLYKRAIDKATSKGEISPEKFVTELGKLEDNFNVFFRGESRAELEGLKKVLTETKRAGEAGVVTPTGQSVVLPATTAIAAAAGTGNPIAIATLLSSGTLGGVARIYETAGVRDLLIKLGKAEKRSTLEADLLNSFPALIGEVNRSNEATKNEI